MLVAKYRSAKHPGKSAIVSAQLVSEHSPGAGEFRCPSCNELVYPVSPIKLVTEKNYRAPYFRHQKAILCNVQDCDQRVDSPSTAIPVTQRLRTPLFLRPSGKGDFILAAGFSSADKDMLRRLSNTANGISIKVPNAEMPLTASLDDMLESGELTFIELPSPVAKRSNWEVSLTTNYGTTISPKGTDAKEWADRLDWFGDASKGAVFEYTAGNAGEKIRFGGSVRGGRAYLVAEKQIDRFPTYMQTSAQDGVIRSYKKLGTLRFRKDHRTTYTVAKVVFPNSTDKKDETFKKAYADLVDKLDNNFGVSLSDTVQETAPLWPPAARMSDAYILTRVSEGNRVHALVSGLRPEDKVYLRSNTKETTEASELQRIPGADEDDEDLAVVTFPVSYARSYATVNDYLPNTLDSFRFGVLRNRLSPQLILTGPNGEQAVFNSSITHTVEWLGSVSITSISTGCTLYQEQNSVQIPAGKGFKLDKPNDEFFVRLNSGVVIHFNPSSAVEVTAEEWDDLPAPTPRTSRSNKYLRTDKYRKYGKYRR